jgi:hypothetical protein
VPLDKSPRIEVVVEEVKSGDWGIGGKPLSTEDVQAFAAGAPAATDRELIRRTAPTTTRHGSTGTWSGWRC